MGERGVKTEEGLGEGVRGWERQTTRASERRELVCVRRGRRLGLARVVGGCWGLTRVKGVSASAIKAWSEKLGLLFFKNGSRVWTFRPQNNHFLFQVYDRLG